MITTRRTISENAVAVTLNLDPPKMDSPEQIFQKYMDPLELIFQ